MSCRGRTWEAWSVRCSTSVARWERVARRSCSRRMAPRWPSFSRQRIPVLVLDQLLRDTDGARRLQAFAARCAIVHMHCMWDQPGVRRMADRLGLPLVVTLHGRARLPRLSCPVICVSDVVAHEQPRGTRVSVIPNSVDTRVFRYRDPRPAESFRVIRVCRKGRCADYFWEAAELVLAAEPNAEFWVVGERGRARKRVRFLGRGVFLPLPHYASHGSA